MEGDGVRDSSQQPSEPARITTIAEWRGESGEGCSLSDWQLSAREGSGASTTKQLPAIGEGKGVRGELYGEDLGLEGEKRSGRGGGDQQEREREGGGK